MSNKSYPDTMRRIGEILGQHYQMDVEFNINTNIFDVNEKHICIDSSLDLKEHENAKKD